MKRIYIIVAVIIVVIILYIYATRASESYIDTPFNLIVIDGDGNMSSVSIRPPSLAGIPPTSNIVYVNSSGNLGVMSFGDVYTSYQGNSSNNVRNLLTIDANNNFSVLSTLNFNPCHVNGDPMTNPTSTMNGKPQPDGTCTCSPNWVGKTKGDGCTLTYGSTIRISTSTDKLFNGKKTYIKPVITNMDAPWIFKYAFSFSPDETGSELVWSQADSDPSNQSKEFKGMIGSNIFGRSLYAYVSKGQDNVDPCGSLGGKVNDYTQKAMCLNDKSVFDIGSTADTTEFIFKNVNGVKLFASDGFVAGKALSITKICNGYQELAGFFNSNYSDPLSLLIEVKGTDGKFYPVDL